MTNDWYLPEGYGGLLQSMTDTGDDVPCSNYPDLFFPDKGGSAAEAKKLCQGCPIKLQCLEYALKANEPYGVWGGTTPRERDRLKRVRRN